MSRKPVFVVTGAGALLLGFAPGGIGGFVAELPRPHVPLVVKRVVHA